MNNKINLQLLLVVILMFYFVLGTTSSSRAGTTLPAGDSITADAEEFDPFAPNALELLNEFDRAYELQTGQSPYLTESPVLSFVSPTADCKRETCRVWARVSKKEQMLYLYIDGKLQGPYPVSTGLNGRTPNFDRHPDGRIYDKYSSKTYPGGDYNGLGNMPYAVFISGPFAIHGTPSKNWGMLGKPASKGCIRLHPDNARIFNRFVREAGVGQTWITVE